MNNYQSKFAVRQKVFIPRLNETGEIFGVTFYDDQVTYQLQAHSYDGEIGENEICAVEEWPKVGSFAFSLIDGKIRRGVITECFSLGAKVSCDFGSFYKYQVLSSFIFKTAEECRAAIPVVE